MTDYKETNSEEVKFKFRGRERYYAVAGRQLDEDQRRNRQLCQQEGRIRIWYVLCFDSCRGCLGRHYLNCRMVWCFFT